MNIRNFLDTLELFKGIDTATLDELASKAALAMAAGTQQIVKQGDLGTHVFIIYEGEVDVCTEKGGCDPQSVATLKAGDIFGEMSAMTGEPSRADVVPKGLCKLIKIPAPVFKDIVKRNFRSMGKISSTMVKRYSGLSKM